MNKVPIICVVLKKNGISEKFAYYWHRCIDMYNSDIKVVVVTTG